MRVKASQKRWHRWQSTRQSVREFSRSIRQSILLILAFAAPQAAVPLPAIGPFMPMCALTVFTTAGIAAFLLGAQFTVTRQPVLGALGGAYAFTALAVALLVVIDLEVEEPPPAAVEGPPGIRIRIDGLRSDQGRLVCALFVEDNWLRAGAIAGEHEKKKIPEAIRQARVAAVSQVRERP